jgi:hypothetical protein
MLALSLEMGGTHIMRGGNVALLRTGPLLSENLSTT